MKRTYREKINFILNYNEDFDRQYLLEDCLDMLTEEQLKNIFESSYEEDYKEAWEYYEENKEDYENEEPDD